MISGTSFHLQPQQHVELAPRGPEDTAHEGRGASLGQRGGALGPDRVRIGSEADTRGAVLLWCVLSRFDVHVRRLLLNHVPFSAALGSGMQESLRCYHGISRHKYVVLISRNHFATPFTSELFYTVPAI